MTHLDQALQALTTLRAEDRPGGLTAKQALERTRLAAALQREQAQLQAPETLLRSALTQRGAAPDATHPAWRALICALAAHAIANGVPTSTVIQAIRADQLASDLAREPRLFGEALVISEGGQLRLHADILYTPPSERALH